MGASFDFICRDLSRTHYCIAPDFRGFGKSQHGKNEVGYFFYEYLADVHDLLNKFAPDEKITLLGHSMGGSVAALYAGTFPEKISGLINIEGFGITDRKDDAGPKQARLWVESRVYHPFKVYKNIPEVATRLQKTNPRLPRKRALFLAKHLSRKVRGGFQIAADPRHKWPNPYLYRMDGIIPFWKNITAKCLLITAEQTEMALWLKTSDDVHTELERRLDYFPADSTRVKIANCGHMVHHEKPEELVQVIRDFMSKP